MTDLKSLRSLAELTLRDTLEAGALLKIARKRIIYRDAASTFHAN